MQNEKLDTPILQLGGVLMRGVAVRPFGRLTMKTDPENDSICRPVEGVKMNWAVDYDAREGGRGWR